MFLNTTASVGILIGVVNEEGSSGGAVYWQTIGDVSDSLFSDTTQTISDTIYYFINDTDYHFSKDTSHLGPLGSIVNRCGPLCHYPFGFVDPINIPQTLRIDTTIKDGQFEPWGTTDEPLINKVMVMEKNKIWSLLNEGTAFDYHIFSPYSMLMGSNGLSEPFDFSAKPFFLDRENYLFVTDDGSSIYGHNFRNMGNFLWGATTEIFGIPQWIALAGAHTNNIFTNDWSLDSTDDQLSIKLGRKYAETMGWKTIYGGKANIFKN